MFEIPGSHGAPNGQYPEEAVEELIKLVETGEMDVTRMPSMEELKEWKETGEYTPSPSPEPDTDTNPEPDTDPAPVPDTDTTDCGDCEKLREALLTISEVAASAF